MVEADFDQRVAEPDTAALLNRMVVDFADAPLNPNVAERRAALDKAALLYGPEPEPVGKIEDRAIDGPGGPIPLRIYWPQERGAPYPILVNLHGGGWVLGGPDGYERVARAYSAAGQCIVVDVDYRLAPENKHPAALDDCMAALSWVAENAEMLGGDPRRIIITGDSAGGFLAALVAQQTDVPLAGQILVYPVCTASSRQEFASRKALGDGRFFLREFDILRAEEEYFAGSDAKEKAGGSPLLADNETLRRLPPTLIVTASLDPLVDEGRLYAERIKAAGVPTEYICAEGTIHGFVLFAGALALGQHIISNIGAWVRRVEPVTAT
ncbi:alpha/beta hydrolase [Allosphingosinicella vermicomposti]|uniref:alpha/beta hydrolase n=1 Tax=Allosphingosinicella vermicomposti TaxID=614671 RepID=UPI000D10AD25|nr:alpha/beta hydrolase [Allosphingosinicella vermicomposti]